MQVPEKPGASNTDLSLEVLTSQKRKRAKCRSRPEVRNGWAQGCSNCLTYTKPWAGSQPHSKCIKHSMINTALTCLVLGSQEALLPVVFERFQRVTQRSASRLSGGEDWKQWRWCCVLLYRCTLRQSPSSWLRMTVWSLCPTHTFLLMQTLEARLYQEESAEASLTPGCFCGDNAPILSWLTIILLSELFLSEPDTWRGDDPCKQYLLIKYLVIYITGGGGGGGRDASIWRGQRLTSGVFP